ncbi:hypothetical protein KEM60_00920 [Austwickia sp. TVS 96-490-7B]|nr:hypothetical protein [Austwickia sp. TVS 96-490-7B]
MVRWRDDRWIAGVARGIAARWDIDPVLLRIALILTAFVGGLGVAMYLLGWLVLPDEDGNIPLVRAFREHHGIPMVVVALIISAMVIVGTPADQAAGALILLGAFTLWLLWQRTDRSPSAPLSSPQVEDVIPPRMSSPHDVTLLSPPVPPAALRPPQPRRRHPGWHWWLIILGLALLVWPVTWLISRQVGTTANVAHVIASAVTCIVLGTAVTVQGARGYRTLGTGTFTALLAVGALCTPAGLDGIPRDGLSVGVRHWTPTVATELQDHYQLTVGDGQIDLSALSRTDLAGRSIRADVGVGRLQVRIPADVPVNVIPRVRAGQIILRGTPDGEPVNHSDDQTALRLVAEVTAGDIEIERTPR